MTGFAIILALSAIAAASTGGFFLGARKGVGARDGLRGNIHTLEGEVATLGVKLHETSLRPTNQGGGKAAAQALKEAKAANAAQAAKAEQAAKAAKAAAVKAEQAAKASAAKAAKAAAEQAAQMNALVLDFKTSMERRESELQTHVSETLTSLTGSLVAQQTSDNEAQNALQGKLEALSQKIHTSMGQTGVQDQLQEQLEALSEKLHSSMDMKGELQSMMELQKKNEEQNKWQQEMRELLVPLANREQIKSTLSHIDAGRGTRSELPRLLEAIKDKGEFMACMLIDEAGLPMATSSGPVDSEVIAGLTALVLQLIDRIKGAGEAAPMSLSVHDEDDRFILHRFLRVREERYVLTAISQGNPIPHNALDPVLATIEKVLSTEEWNLAEPAKKRLPRP